MLVPGEYLTCPVPPEQMRSPTPTRLEVERFPELRITRTVTTTTVTTTTVTTIENPESRSFLSILLRALGAVHT